MEARAVKDWKFGYVLLPEDVVLGRDRLRWRLWCLVEREPGASRSGNMISGESGLL